jgi:hypothetical protein
MSKFLFYVPEAGDNQLTAVYARLYEAADPLGEFTQVGLDTALSGLEVSGDFYILDVPEVDGTKYYRLTLLSSELVESQPASLGPMAVPGKVVVEIWSSDVLGEAVGGLKFYAKSNDRVAKAGILSVLKTGETVTNSVGYASLELFADSGIYTLFLSCGDVVERVFDTAGKAGQTVNFNDL